MNILIFFLLLVTIPRYSAAFGDIDNWAVFGFAVTAIGEAIAMGLGEYTITRTLLRCNQAQARHRSEYESLKARNDETGRGTRKLDHIPELVGSGRVLGVFLILLEALGILSQIPHFVAALRGTDVSVLLGDWLWGYVAILIVQPGVLQAALSFAGVYKVTLDGKAEGIGALAELRSLVVGKIKQGLSVENRNSKPQSSPPRAELTERQKEILWIWAEDPALSQAAVAAKLSVPTSRGTVANEWAALVRSGIAKRNGNGVEVLCKF